jgi:hypothetical protein
MRLFPSVIKRITTIISGGLVNFLLSVKPATRLQTLATLLTRQKPATKLTMAPSSLTVPQRSGTRLTTFSTATLAKASQRLASRLSITSTGTIKLNQRPATKIIAPPFTLLATEKPATEMVQQFINLEHKSFVVTMTNDTANVRSWTNPANAQGANNATNAVWDGSLAVAQTGKMHGTLVAQPNRPYVIDSVWMAVWGSWSGLPVVDDLLSGLTIGYRIGGLTALDVQTIRRGTRVTWANIALLQFYAGGQTLVGVASTFNVDAIRLRVVAHDTQAL